MYGQWPYYGENDGGHCASASVGQPRVTKAARDYEICPSLFLIDPVKCTYSYSEPLQYVTIALEYDPRVKAGVNAFMTHALHQKHKHKDMQLQVQH